MSVTKFESKTTTGISKTKTSESESEYTTFLGTYSTKPDWFMIWYMFVCHSIALYAVLKLVFLNASDINNSGSDNSDSTSGKSGPNYKTIIFSISLYWITALGVTAGKHRLWAHRSYEAAWPLRLFLMILCSIANQKSIYQWCRDHRAHHLKPDTPADPHNARRGFFFSHIGWLFLRRTEECKELIRSVRTSDLLEDGFVKFQWILHPYWELMWCFLFPMLVTGWFLGDSYVNGFLYAGMLRYVLWLHGTFAVNSFVHMGEKEGASTPYIKEEYITNLKTADSLDSYSNHSLESSSRLNSEDKDSESVTVNSTSSPLRNLKSILSCDNGWVSFFTGGEGWHSWHHEFAWDYAAAELGCLQQYNPTKCFLDFLANEWIFGRFAPVKNRRRGLVLWERRKEEWRKEIEALNSTTTTSKFNESDTKIQLKESLVGPPLFKCRKIEFVASNSSSSNLKSLDCKSNKKKI